MKISLEFKLDKHDSAPAPHMRAWVDVDKSGHLTDGEEVNITAEKLTWAGDITSNEQTTDEMLFIVKYLASPGAKWTMTLTGDTPSAHEIFKASGTVKQVEGRIVGRMRP